MVPVHVLASSCLFHRCGDTGDVSSTIFRSHQSRCVHPSGGQSSWKSELPGGLGGSAWSRTVLVSSCLPSAKAAWWVVDVRTNQELPATYVSSEFIFRSRVLCKCLFGTLSP